MYRCTYCTLHLGHCSCVPQSVLNALGGGTEAKVFLSLFTSPAIMMHTDKLYASDDLHCRSWKCNNTGHLRTQHHLHFCSQSILGLSSSFGYKSLESRDLNSTSAVLTHQNPFHKFKGNLELRIEVKFSSLSNQHQNRVEHDRGFFQHPALLTTSPVSYIMSHFTTQSNHQSRDKIHNWVWNSTFNRFADVRGSKYESLIYRRRKHRKLLAFL